MHWDQLEAALDRLEPVIRAGEPALPTITAGRLLLMIAAEPQDMRDALDRARAILVFKGVRSFMMTGETANPARLYAARIGPNAVSGLARSIMRAGPIVALGSPRRLHDDALTSVAALLPEPNERLDPGIERKIRSLVSLHSQLEAGAPMVIRP